MDHSVYMMAALEEAKAAAKRDEVPVGAVLVDRRTMTITARAGNRTRALNDPSAHAELLVIRDVCRNEAAQCIPDYLLYVTLEPCALCAAAISFARLPRLIYGASDPKGGAIAHGPCFFEQPTCHHRPDVQSGVMALECRQILRDFFKAKR